MKTNRFIIFLITLIASFSSMAESVYDRMLKESMWKADAVKIKQAIKKGADVNRVDYDRFSSLPLQSIKIFVNNGYKLNDEKKGCVIAKTMNRRDIDKSFLKAINYLIMKGANPNCEREGATTLYDITNKRNKYDKTGRYLKAYKMILSKSTQLNDWSAKADSVYVWLNKPISRTIPSNKTLFKLLIDSGADVNGTTRTRQRFGREDWDDIGYSPLSAAVYMNSLDLVKLVLKKGAKINGEKEDSVTPIDYAHKFEYNDIEVYLLEKGGKYRKYSELN